ncbi:MAG TPA: transporter, partial [Pricia sp.]|nr:transporter [Pricia sp.]
MLPKKPRQLLYVLVFLLFSAIGTTAIAHNNVRSIFIEVASVLKDGVSEEADETAYVAIESAAESVKMTGISSAKAADIASAAPAPMFMTIIQGADALVTCSNDGATVARFILCGDSDDRSISLSGGPYGSVSWQLLDGAAPNTNDPCPNTNPSDYNPVSGNQTFLLAASSVSASTGAEYRVVADGQIFYFEVIKSTITQTYTKKDFVCNNPGRIEITGLPNNYQFRIREGSGGFGPYQDSSIFPDLDAGTYTVQTRLNIAGSVCEYLYDPIEIEQVDIEIDVTFTNPVCSGETGSIDVTVNPEVPGPYVYTLLNESGAEIEFTSTISSNTYSFGTVSEGTYAVKVETNDCKEDIPNGIPAPIQYNDTSGNPITVGTGLSPISVTTDTNGMSFGCSTISSVDIDVTPSGGSGTYSYTVSDGGNSGGNFTGTSSYTVTNPGTYTFYITDDQGCTAEKSEYVSELDPPEVTASDITGTCTNGGGKVQFTVTDAKGFNLEYRATNTTGDPFTSSSTIPVADGTYTIVEVRYSQGAFSCILALPPVTVTSAGGLIGSYTLTQDYTCANGEGIIVFDPASGGSGLGYAYSVDNVNYQSGTTFAGLTPGTTYTPYVRDDSGCYQGLTPITISEPVPPTAINFTQDNLDCATGTSRVTVDVLPGGFPVAQYEIVSSNPLTILPPAQTGNVFNGLSLDTSYQFEITDTDGCVYPASFTTGGISSIRARVKSGGDRRVCPGLTDGNGAFLIDGFATDYDYVITGPPNPSSVPSLPASGTSSSSEIPISGLGTGTYEITVTDNDTNCTSTVSFDVVEAATPLNVTLDVVTDMSCQNNNIGSVRAANATGGFPGYRYELEWPPSDGRTQGPKTGRTFGSLTEPGTYILTVIDSEGCRVSTTFDLTEIEAPTIAFGSADYCYSPTNDAGITVTSTAGTGTSDAAVTTHQYRINGGPFQTPGTAGTYTFNNLVPGDYTIEVVDANGCTDGLQVSIPPQLQIDLDLVTEIPCGGDGEMGITVSGGDISNLASTSYTIYLNGTPVAGHTGTALPSSSFNYTVPLGSDGDYTVEVTDNNGCTNTSPPLTFSPPASIAVLPPNVVGPSCGNANSGFVEIFPDVSVGTPPFQVAFAPGGTGLIDDPFNPDPGNTYNYSSQTVYSGLSAGTYEYIVKDARNCTTGVLTVTVNLDTTNPPNATVVPIDATCSGTVVSGGITISNITNGAPEFTIIVEDNYGNELVRRENVTLADLPLPISDPSLVQGDYTVITLDSRGCIDQDGVSINSTQLDIVPNFTAPAVCDRGDLPQCVDIVGGIGPFDIRLVTDPSSPYIDLGPTATSHCFTGLVPGSSYTVQVLDEGTNCEYIETVDIPEGPNPLNVALSIDNGNCNGEDVELEYTITGATGPTFDIVIRNLDTGTVVTNTTTSNTTDTFFVPQGPYDISVIDNGTDCTGGDTVEAVLNMPRVDVIDNQNANCNELGQLTVRGSGGTPYPPSGAGSLPDGSPYEYAFVDAGTPPVSGNYDTETTVYLAGTLGGTPYDIWVRDSRGCEYMTSATVIQLNPDLPDPGIVVNNQCNGTIPPSGFEIEVTMPASVENPTFILDGQTQTPVYDPMNSTTVTFNVGSSIGVYDVYVVDANGCDVTTTAEVYQILSASGNFTEPTCNDTDGIITITANGGSGNFSFELRNGAGTPTGNMTGQTTGIFTG